MYIVISYDMEDDKRRTLLHRALKNYGQWVQYSVFECDLTRAQYVRLRSRLDELIREKEGDSIRLYLLCDDCQRKVERVGGIMPVQRGAVIL